MIVVRAKPDTILFNREKTMKTLIITFVLTILSAEVLAADNTLLKTEYDLQERCGKRAEEIYRKDWGKVGVINHKDYQEIGNFTNHYNKKLNKCFILTSSQQYWTNHTYKEYYELWDINDNKLNGSYYGGNPLGASLQCNVIDTLCNSYKAWESLTKPFMND